ncbi:N-Acetyl-D-glucosamine ABC transport system, sugar-binding protein, partial [hydrothermal vent metagenome]
MRITRRLLVLLSVLALVAAACSSSNADGTTSTTQAATTTEAPGGSESETTTTTTTPPPADKDPITIRYSTFSAAPDNLDALDAMIAAFEAENPDVKVEVETAPFDNYFTLLQTQVAGNDAPDAFELNFESFVTFATKGTLADLGPLTNADQGFDGAAYYQPAFDAFAVNGTQYALPESYSTVMLFFNKDI